jgi:hypothetical protein
MSGVRILPLQKHNRLAFVCRTPREKSPRRITMSELPPQEMRQKKHDTHNNKQDSQQMKIEPMAGPFRQSISG